MTVRSMSVAAATGLLLAVFGMSASVAAADEVERSAKVDALFERWTRATSPGCAVSVTLAGQVVHQGAYGQAVVETATPNGPDTAFHTASLSKQFTAFAIHLLEQDGKLSLDDDVRKHVPELHDFAAPITLRHLLRHASGLRDQWVLLALAGRRLEDTITQKDVIDVILAQRELNFAPGAAVSYSNSNYSLLALIVERASGQSLSDFLASRVFGPLGMKDTYVNDDLRRIRTGQAAPYGPQGARYERRALSFSNYGATNVRSSAADMASWMRQLDRPRIGPEAIAAMTASFATGRNATALAYDSGLTSGEYRGAKTIDHSGMDPGFASHMLTLPQHRLGVTVLCNVETNEPAAIARRVVDIYLGDVLAAASTPELQPVVVNEDRLRPLVGKYQEAGGAIFAVSFRDGKLYMQGADEMVPTGEGTFALRQFPVSFTFSGGEGGAPPTRMTVHDPGQDRPTRRVDLPVVADLTSDAMRPYRGRYYSPELETLVVVEVRGAQLWLKGPGYEARLDQPPAILRAPDVFSTESHLGTVQFLREGDGVASGFTTSTDRSVNVRFLRVNLPVS